MITPCWYSLTAAPAWCGFSVVLHKRGVDRKGVRLDWEEAGAVAMSRISTRCAPLPPGTVPLLEGDPATVGDFTLVARFAAGDPGSAFLGCSARGEQAVIKLAVPRPAGGNRARRNYADAAVARVPDRYAARVISRGLCDGTAYLAREYVQGLTLGELVAEDGPLDPVTLNAVAVSMAVTLAALHDAEAVHGNLKPANVMVTLAGIRLLDHCLGRRSGQPRPRPSSDILGWGRLVAFAGGLRGGDRSIDAGALGKPISPLLERALADDHDQRPTARGLVLGLVCPADSTGASPPTGGVTARLRRRATECYRRP